jgi:hypothetical protein
LFAPPVIAGPFPGLRFQRPLPAIPLLIALSP